MYLTDEEVETADNWITEVQESFTEAMTMKMSYINNIVAIESRARAESKHEEVRNKDREQIQRIIDQTAIRRSTAQVVFETLCQGVMIRVRSLPSKNFSSNLRKYLRNANKLIRSYLIC